ncbi:helix-turn-helix domain-containing protein [Prolixibacter denitrificans]|uniref:AraC-like DNA-binding protein n=1 Tax=Prolixibacter denitrificans TaxID=1541063 RepID=A0A2P8C590_9BACT|nr:helix-turn-helix domain-containing protein [Prolixibacter denitrificans]PSK80131.1 AraC-like DNA-binding protein [Prolixibacter denitrificans]GET22755.1 virulence regulon transcriptional activator VirF [Prolixibacter denitrificans]
MEYKAKYITEDIKLSSYEDNFFKSDIMFDHHMLVWFISGETKIVQSDATYYFKTGDIFLIPRNQLATIINYPKHGQPHKTVVMHLSTERLREFYSRLDIHPKPSASPHILSYNNHPLLQSCLSSLIPYFEMSDIPEDIASLKITEAVSILRSIDQKIDHVLANFEEPGKVNLAEFMEKNYMFNMTTSKFAYLTGRSLTTFKRDFKKAFSMTPQKWLTRKRLELAHYQLKEKNRKPVDVYLETGFENLSHFSYAFKKQYGCSPSQLLPGDHNIDLSR